MTQRAWLVTSGEPLPFDGDDVRLLRHGLLAQELVRRGWDVTWWTSAFDHTSKRHRAIPMGDAMLIGDRYRIVLLASRGYSRHVSVRRLRDHADIASEFGRRAPTRPRPDVILASFPTIALADAAVRFAGARNVPIALDLRDLWPDIFLETVPKWLRGVGRLVLRRQFCMAKSALRDANALTGITDAFVSWGLVRAERERDTVDRSFPLASPALDAIDESVDRLQLLREIGLEPHHKLACFFGAVGQQFDWDTVVCSAAEVAKIDDQIRFVICGVGERFNEVRERTREIGNVVMPGWIDRTMIGTIMGVAKVGLAPYTNELSFSMSIPNKVIEYLAGGLPVVSSLRGETQRLLSEHELDFHFEYGDHCALTRQIVSVCNNDPRTHGARSRARDLFQSRFDASLVYGRMSDWLLEISQCSFPANSKNAIKIIK